MWSDPVIFGGGITRQKCRPGAFIRGPIEVLRDPETGPAGFDVFRRINLGDLGFQRDLLLNKSGKRLKSNNIYNGCVKVSQTFEGGGGCLGLK